MTDIDLETHLKQFESPELEFKEALPSGVIVARVACAFANGRGGKLIFGVRDEDRAVVGVNPAEVFELEGRVTSIIHDSVEAQIAPQYTTLLHAGKTLFVVHIFPGSLKPYFLKAEGKAEGTYIRIGSQTRKADAAAIRELDLQRANITYDQMPVHDAKGAEISDANVRHFIEKRRAARGVPPVDPSEAFLAQFGALKAEGDRAYPTVGGLLLFSDRPQDHFPYAKVKCARFKGTGVGEFLDQREFEGPLYKQIEGTMAFYKAHVQRGARIKGTYRQEQDAYPEVAVREAIANAVCHRDYNVVGSDVRFAMFDDRIEITSPGGLPSRITVQLLGTGVSEARNRVIARVFREMGIIEEWGQGTTRMREAMTEWGLPEPTFREQGQFFKVILSGAAAAATAATAALDPDEQKLLAIATSEGRVTTGVGMEATGRSRPTVIRKLAHLQELGLLVWKGSSPKDPTGHFVPKERAS